MLVESGIITAAEAGMLYDLIAAAKAKEQGQDGDGATAGCPMYGLPRREVTKAAAMGTCQRRRLLQMTLQAFMALQPKNMTC
jgi:hypothetical protein